MKQTGWERKTQQPFQKITILFFISFTYPYSMTQESYSWSLKEKWKHVYTKTFIRTFIAALFIIAPNWKLKCPSVKEKSNCDIIIKWKATEQYLKKINYWYPYQHESQISKLLWWVEESHARGHSIYGRLKDRLNHGNRDQNKGWGRSEGGSSRQRHLKQSHKLWKHSASLLGCWSHR